MDVNIGGPHRGHAAGNTDVEKQAPQLASDVKFKVKKKMGPHTDMNPAQVAQAYERQLASSPAPGPVKAIARKKLKIGVTEQYGIGELAKESTVNALIKVFVEGVTVEEEVEDIAEADERKYWVVVTDKKTGNTYRRQATRPKIAELRANPNIRRVEMTGYHPNETDDKQGKKTSKVKAGKGLDPVGREDPDLNNNDISNDKSDKYLLKRRAAVGNAIQKRNTVSASYEMNGQLIDESEIGDRTRRVVGDQRQGVHGNADAIKRDMDTTRDNLLKLRPYGVKGFPAVKKEEFFPEAKKTKKKSDTITGEGVNNSKRINLKPTMEQTETPVSSQKPDSEEQQKIRLRQKQVQAALNRQRQTMQLQRSGRLPLNYSDDYTPEGEDIQEVSPPGMEGTVKAMKKYPELSRGKTPEGKEKNIYALAWFMKNKGYKSHKTKSGADK